MGITRDVTSDNTTERSYFVGLPVFITVRNDGTVTYTVDTSEAADAIRESGGETVQMTTTEGDRAATDAQVDADADAADAAHTTATAATTH